MRGMVPLMSMDPPWSVSKRSKAALIWLTSYSETLAEAYLLASHPTLAGAGAGALTFDLALDIRYFRYIIPNKKLNPHMPTNHRVPKKQPHLHYPNKKSKFYYNHDPDTLTLII